MGLRDAKGVEWRPGKFEGLDPEEFNPGPRGREAQGNAPLATAWVALAGLTGVTGLAGMVIALAAPEWVVPPMDNKRIAFMLGVQLAGGSALAMFAPLYAAGLAIFILKALKMERAANSIRSTIEVRSDAVSKNLEGLWEAAKGLLFLAILLGIIATLAMAAWKLFKWAWA